MSICTTNKQTRLFFCQLVCIQFHKCRDRLRFQALFIRSLALFSVPIYQEYTVQNWGYQPNHVIVKYSLDYFEHIYHTHTDS